MEGQVTPVKSCDSIRLDGDSRRRFLYRPTSARQNIHSLWTECATWILRCPLSSPYSPKSYYKDSNLSTICSVRCISLSFVPGRVISLYPQLKEHLLFASAVWSLTKAALY